MTSLAIAVTKVLNDLKLRTITDLPNRFRSLGSVIALAELQITVTRNPFCARKMTFSEMNVSEVDGNELTNIAMWPRSPTCGATASVGLGRPVTMGRGFWSSRILSSTLATRGILCGGEWMAKGRRGVLCLEDLLSVEPSGLERWTVSVQANAVAEKVRER